MAFFEELSVESAPDDRPGEGYRPHLDGLRAVAVYLVVLYHAGIGRFLGGFIGVDVFFVLSGYLVSQLLIRDLLAGGTRFGRFYARRMRRLLPASLIALLVTGVVYSALASQADIASAVDAFKAAFLYVANWFFIHRAADYFDSNVSTNPVVHFWSLAIEEQFYFVWPILLTTLFLITRRLRSHAHRARQVTVATGALVSLVWALHLSGENLNRAYYGTDARAYQLLAGALLALSPGFLRRAGTRRAALVSAPLALAALVVLSTSYVHLTPIGRGVATTITSLVLITAIESVRRGPVNRLLSSSPAVYLGKISYGTYLWHWPVIVALTLAFTDRTISKVSMFALAAVVATGLASLSYHLIERPIREERFLDRINPVVVATGLTIAVVAALVVVPQVLDPYRTHGTAAHATTNTGFTPIPNLNFTAIRNYPRDLKGIPFLKTWNCNGQPVAKCTIIKSTGESILLIGDSHAQMFLPTFAEIARAHGLTLSTAMSAGCPWQRNLYLPPNVAFVNNDQYTTPCISFKRDLYDRVIPQLKPDLIIAISSDYLTRRPGVIHDKNNKPLPTTGTADFRRRFKADTEQSVKTMVASAGKVLLVEPVPTTLNDKDPFACLTQSRFLEDCRFVADDNHQAAQVIYEGLAENKRVYAANFDKLLCPYLPICDPVINGTIARKDAQHISPAFADSLTPAVTAFLQGKGLIPSG